MSNTDEQFVLGVDAGGTKTQVVLWRQAVAEKLYEYQVSESDIMQSALWQDKFPGINLDAIDTHTAYQRIASILEQASYKARMTTARFCETTQVIIGMAGLDTPQDQRRAGLWLQTSWLQLGVKSNLPLLIPDIELALWSANRQGVGIVLIAGTGSNCYGRNYKGEVAKTGGMSHYFSDEGSGFMLGWKALHEVAKMYDGRRETTALLGQVLAAYNVADFASLKNAVINSTDRKKTVAIAAPVVQALAMQGEPGAVALVDSAIADLAEMVETVWKKLDSQTLPVFLVGSLFKDEAYRQRLVLRLQELGIPSQYRWIEAPVIGAIQVAERLRASQAKL
jgi:N-acetylglucosamine kinase-like BadF-type ATPase